MNYCKNGTSNITFSKCISEEFTTTGTNDGESILSDINITRSENDIVHYIATLPQNVNVIGDITEKMHEITDVSIAKTVTMIIESFSRQIDNLLRITPIDNKLSKLGMQIDNDESVLLEWNYNNFRIGFSVEHKIDDSSYFIVTDDKINGEIFSVSRKFKPQEINNIVKSILTFALRYT